MKGLGKWSVENRVTVNLIMIFLIVAGLYTILDMRREMFPQFAVDMINVSIVYPGASPEEVEEGICIKVEEQLKGIEDVSKISSHSHEGYGSITLEFDSGVDIQEKLTLISTEVDLIDTFPDEAEEPVIKEIKNQNPAITVAVFGDVPEKLLRNAAEKIRDELVDAESISMAELVGVRDYEISIEVSEANLRKFNLSFDQVAMAVKSGSMDLPGGSIKTSGQEFIVRAKGRLYTGDEFEKIPVITREDGTVVRLCDVAEVVDGFEDTDIKARFNGMPAALVQVNRTSSQDVITIAKAVKQYVAQQRFSQPEGVSLACWYDLSEMVQGRIDLLLKNGAQGILLVFIVLALFLNLKLAFWVAAGIPISFMGAFIVLHYLGASINMLSLFGFIMTLGILVDDAIIVGENIFSHYSRGKSSKDAVIDGLKEVGGSVVMAVTTTIVAFMPLMHIAGIMGKFIAIMPQTVIAILVLSLVEALVILPAHLDHALSGESKTTFFFSWHTWIRNRVDTLQDKFIRKLYTPLLKYAVTNRYLTLTFGMGILIISIGVVAGNHVPFVFFPKGDSDWVIAEIGYPLGTPFETTENSIKHLEKSAFQLNSIFGERVDSSDDLKGGLKVNLKNNRKDEINNDLLVNVFSLVGVIPRRDWKIGQSGGHCGEVWIEIQSAEKRPDLSVTEVLAKWRSLAGKIAGTETLTFSSLEGGPGGNPIEIQLSVGEREHFDQLQAAANDLKKEISTYPGTFDITDNFRPGKMEKRISIKQGAKSIGVTMADVAKQIRQAYYGDEVLRVQRGKDDVKVMVRYSEKERQEEASLDEMRIRTRDGREIPLMEVASLKEQKGYSVINRVDRKRVITVIADIDENRANAREIVNDLKKGFFKKLVQKYPGVNFDLEGQAKRSKESLDSLKHGFLFAVMGIFLLLASQFGSYLQPGIIMMAIPFGLIGAIIGHFVMGLAITMLSIFGIVALSGIVVNDSLILIDFINSRAKKGEEFFSAVIESGKSRFRPVILTSFTTIAGLSPLLFERSFQAQFLIPMAVSISFGLVAATFLTLLYVPALYMIMEDIRKTSFFR
ncbi:MAG: efflux RND transporter permease subunit [Thermodesulfobacteriota bacterium]|nr:efflux RND transporter permease subunit [Thermodesulfobacteriota bacterium]